jgi:hypothetical protein
MMDDFDRLSLDELRSRLRASTVVRRSWVERKAPEATATWCLCATPRPERVKTALFVYQTCECGRCGRAIFTAEGAPITEVAS